MNREQWAWYVGLLSIVLYVTACAASAVDCGDGNRGGDTIRLGSPPGWLALIMGWMPPFTLPWLANPVWLIGVIGLYRESYYAALCGGVVASLLGLTTLFLFPPFDPNEHPLAGYYLWQGSLLALALAACPMVAGGQATGGRGKRPLSGLGDD